MSELINFQFETHQIRTVMINGDPWWVAKDICDVIGLSNPSEAVKAVDLDDLSQTEVIDSIGRKQKTNIVNESGLYTLILRSDKPEARSFKRWITSDVLPSLRKSGAYALQQNDDQLIVSGYQAAIRKIELLQQKITDDKPKVEFYDSVAGSKDAIAIGEAAKVLNLGMGRNRVFEVLRARKVLAGDNLPYQKYIDAGWFRVIEQRYNKPTGETRINLKTLVYQKGLKGIRDIITSGSEITI